MVKSEVSKTTYFSPFLAYDVIVKLMPSLKSMTFSKAHDRKHYLDNQSEDSSKGYLRKGCHLQYYLAKVNENMHIQKPAENLILWKTAWANLRKLFRVCSRDIYHAKKHKNNSLAIYSGLSLFSPRLTGLIRDNGMYCANL